MWIRGSGAASGSVQKFYGSATLSLSIYERQDGHTFPQYPANYKTDKLTNNSSKRIHNSNFKVRQTTPCTLSLELTVNHLYLESWQTTNCTLSLERTSTCTLSLYRPPLVPWVLTDNHLYFDSWKATLHLVLTDKRQPILPWVLTDNHSHLEAGQTITCTLRLDKQPLGPWDGTDNNSTCTWTCNPTWVPKNIQYLNTWEVGQVENADFPQGVQHRGSQLRKRILFLGQIGDFLTLVTVL